MNKEIFRFCIHSTTTCINNLCSSFTYINTFPDILPKHERTFGLRRRRWTTKGKIDKLWHYICAVK